MAGYRIAGEGIEANLRRRARHRFGKQTLKAIDGIAAERHTGAGRAGWRWRIGRGVHRSGAAIPLVLALAGCQTALNQTYDPSLKPSDTPQIRSEVQKNDPSAKLGAREHPRILATYGGEYKDEKTEKLVARIVGGLTAVSENPNQTYRITVLDSPSVNAFALPGGYIYVTRGLLALANDASEVAAVIAHEMGHVLLNHGVERQRFEEAQSINTRVVNEVLSDALASNAALAQSKLKLAAFSRRQELQADAVGVKLLGEAGYDPYAAARFLQTMEAYARYAAQDPSKDQSLDFLSSHPSTPQRVALARQHAAAVGPEGTGDKGESYFLNGIDGLLFGDRPQEGYVRGRVFMHPRLGIRFEVPPGFHINNTAEAVLATGPGDLAIRFDGVDDTNNQSLSDYLASGWVTGLQANTIQSGTINGLPVATARAVADKWDFVVTVFRVDSRIYRILTAAPHGADQQLDQAATAVQQSFRPLTDAESKSIKPLRIRVVTVRPGDTVASLSARMLGTDRKEQLFRVINALDDGRQVTPGQRVKIVSE